MSAYEKDHLSFEEQVELLQSRGLKVSDVRVAVRELRMIGYYRLSAYTHPFRVPLRPSVRGHDQRLSEFLPGADFDTVLLLWEFDRKLRLILLDFLERFEIALRTAVAYRLGKRHRFGHLTLEALAPTFTEQPASDQSERLSKWDRWLIEYHGRQESASDEAFVSWFNFKYDGKLPIWVAVEILQWGQLSQLYGGMRVEDRETIAREFGLASSKQFRSWIASMNDVRNFCAHHARLWNRVLVKQASRPRRGEILNLDHLTALTDSQRARLYPTLAIMVWMSRDLLGLPSWAVSVREHLLSFPVSQHVDLSGAGFPDDWASLDLWK